MNDRDDLELRAWADRAFDDEPTGGSLGDTIGDDLTRARFGLARRRRWTAGASGVAVAAVAFAIALAPSVRDAVPSDADDVAPAGGGQGRDRPSLSAEDRDLLVACEDVANLPSGPAKPRHDASRISEGSSNTAGPPRDPRIDLDDWTVVDRVDDAWGTTAILLNPDATRWAECTVGEQAGFYTKAVTTPQRVPQGFVKQPDGSYTWKGGDYVNWSTTCDFKADPPSGDCERDLYFLATRVPVGVGSISMETYDGAETEARVTDGFALIRTFGPFLNDYTGPLPGSSTTAPIYLTYRAPGGELLSRYNAEFLPPLPPECDGPGGC